MRGLTIALGVAVVLIGLIGLLNDLRLAVGGAATQARIVGVSGAQVTYEYQDKNEPGQKYTNVAQMATVPPLKVGDRMRIVYLQSNPDLSKPAGVWPRWPFALLAIGLVGIAASVFTATRYGRKRPPVEQEGKSET